MKRARTAPVILVAIAMLAAQAEAEKLRKQDTIGSLDNRQVEVRRGGAIPNSADLARDNYRAFLDLVSDDPNLRAEAMRRLGDLELEAVEARQLGENIDSLGSGGYDDAVELYRQLLAAYPDYRRNDTVLYQLARGYEIAGQTDEALAALSELAGRYPDTPMIDEVQFRRGEMLFLRKRYDEAESAYRAVVSAGESSRYFEQSLYKLGWARFKLAAHDESLEPFFALLDRRIGDVEFADGENRLEALSRAERELVEDTFRVLSISFSYMDGAASIDEFMAAYGQPDYAHVIYMNLGDLYLEKDRYVDAAEAYEAFVDQDPLHPKAPLLQAEVIEAYKQGGFPSLVLEGKKGFVDRYGMDGEFWVRNPPAQNAAVVAHLKANLTELAQHYHARAQKDGRQSDYREAADWYRKYLAYFPEDPDSASTNFLLAEILFESGDLAVATREYERTAYGYALHDRSAEAGYAALLAYRKHERTLDGQERIEWHRAFLDSGLRFAKAYPEHPESGAVLTTVAEDLFKQRQYDLAIAVGRAVVTKQPPVDVSLARTAWRVIAHAQFDTLNFADAELAYNELQSRTPGDDMQARADVRERIASSIYKQGEIARDAGDLETAVTHFTRIASVVPESGIRQTAEYDAAAALINLEAWDRASGLLEKFRGDYPDSEFSDDVTQKLAVSYVKSGRDVDAAREFERIAAASGNTESVRREALWTASALYEASGLMADEQRVLEAVVARYPEPLAESIEARYRLLRIAEATGSHELRERRLREIVQADSLAGPQRSDRTRYLAATASLELAEPVRERFERLRLIQPLDDSIRHKRQLMEEVIKAYTRAAEYGVAAVTTAATYRLAEVYQNFSADLMASERPPDLDELALEQYELLLEEQTFPIEEKAIDLYKANTDRAADGVYDKWVEKSFARLAELMPARYAKMERSEDVVTVLF